MKRQAYKVTLWRPENDLIWEATAYAHNSGVRKSEELVRRFARENGLTMTGGKPHRDENGYVRIWRGSGREVTACVVPL